MAYNTTNEPGTGSTGVVTALILVIVGLILGYLVFNYGGFRSNAPATTDGGVNIQLPGGTDAGGTQ